ncbi:MAG: DEAD/DEAH box helicase [Bacteroidales bacterium]|jgi:ATP-dependent RNA helicase DeaD|nr:DEAD/DEAH box helicase [Bacteroidales bacterium]
MIFKDLNLNASILQATDELGFVNPTPVQEQVIPILLEQQIDLVALAQTGTGKTAAYGLPIIQNINPNSSQIEALILSPTRELCIQIAKDCTNFAKYLPKMNVVSIYGGASIDRQRHELQKGAKIICATPGRMLDMIKRKYINISNVRYVVLDEADEMLNMGFKEDLDSILQHTPEQKSTLLFSATMPRDVENISQSYMNNPIRVTVGEKNAGAENVKHYYYTVHAKDRYLALKRIADFYPSIYAIVFCRTRIETQDVADMLIRDGYNADSLHGDLSQAQRDHVMSRFRNKNLQILVATDVAARGLDVNNLTHVINYNLPDDFEIYTHRSGRTGRADKTGISIAIVNLKEKSKLKYIEKSMGKQFTQVPVPTGDMVCRKQLFHFMDHLESTEINLDEINDYVQIINKKFAYIEKEDLIARLVSLELSRLLQYYKNVPDLNIPEESERGSKGRRDSGSRSDGDHKFTTLQINIGKRDNVAVDKLIRIINEKTNNRDIKIGKIDIFESCSKFDVEPKFAEEVIQKFKGFVFQNREVGVIEGGQGKRKEGSRGGERSERTNWKDRKRNEGRGNNDYKDRKRSDSRRSDSRKSEGKSFGEKRKFRR